MPRAAGARPRRTSPTRPQHPLLLTVASASLRLGCRLARKPPSSQPDAVRHGRATPPGKCSPAGAWSGEPAQPQASRKLIGWRSARGEVWYVTKGYVGRDLECDWLKTKWGGAFTSGGIGQRWSAALGRRRGEPRTVGFRGSGGWRGPAAL